MKWMTTNAPKAVAWSCGKEKATGSSAKPFMWHTKDGPQGDRCSLDLHLELLRLERVGTMLDLGDTEPPWQLHVSPATKATMSAHAHRWFDPEKTAAPALDENELLKTTWKISIQTTTSMAGTPRMRRTCQPRPVLIASCACKRKQMR